VQLDFDPAVITFTDLLELFWKEHDPRIRTWSRQYQSALYTHTEEQLQMALADIAHLDTQSSRKVQTVVGSLDTFYIAEDYHQKHYLQQFPVLMREFETYFAYFSDFNDSPAAAKVNAFASGKGSRNELEMFLPKLQLSAQSEKLLLERSRR
jgi:peptide-methionine (S)-S-oxide reductase